MRPICLVKEKREHHRQKLFQVAVVAFFMVILFLELNESVFVLPLFVMACNDAIMINPFHKKWKIRNHVFLDNCFVSRLGISSFIFKIGGICICMGRVIHDISKNWIVFQLLSRIIIITKFCGLNPRNRYDLLISSNLFMVIGYEDEMTTKKLKQYYCPCKGSVVTPIH